MHEVCAADSLIAALTAHIIYMLAQDEALWCQILMRASGFQFAPACGGQRVII